ncbi:MAG: hypothetical protein V1703_03305, partial [Candidatus Altiarchaeota archaeon]
MKGFLIAFFVFVLLPSSMCALMEEQSSSCVLSVDVCGINESVEKTLTEPGRTFESAIPNVTCIVYFYGLTCPKCAETTPFIQALEDKYCNRIRIHYIEIYHNETNYELYSNYADSKGIPLEKRAIPLAAIGDRYFMGLTQIKLNLEDEILRENPSESICPVTGKPGCSLEYNPIDLSPSKKMEVTIPLVLVTGLVDSINPCAFAVMIFLLTFLFEVSSSSRRVLKAGLAYIISVYVTYFLSGLGFLSVVQLMGISGLIVKIA